jgi:predicted ester cyclase
MSAENELIVRRYVEEVLNQGNLAALDELVDDNFQNRADDASVLGIGGGHGRDGTRRGVADLRSAVPDLRYTIHNVTSSGDRVELRWTAEGTQRGHLMRRAATNRRGRISGRAWVRIQNGKIVEGGSDWNPRDLESQLG